MDEMEGAAVLRYAERPVMPGKRLVIWAPRGHPLLSESLFAGLGFAIEVRGSAAAEGGQWRTVLLSWDVEDDGTLLEVEVEGRYPAGVTARTAAARS